MEVVMEEVEVVEVEVVIAFEVKVKNVGNSDSYKLVHQQRSDKSLQNWKEKLVQRPQVKQVKGMPQPTPNRVLQRKQSQFLKKHPATKLLKRRPRRVKQKP